MSKKTYVANTLLALAAGACLYAADINLPAANRKNSDKFIFALNNRKSSRNFIEKELSAQTLADLLWAANGINREDGHRTAPTGLNVQDIDVYVILKEGIYLYDSQNSKLQEVVAGDFRAVSGIQDFVKFAPVNLVYVQNLEKAMKANETNTARHDGLHAGAIMQNVYLFCAANNLGSVARDYMDREALGKAMQLKENQRIILAQSVGYTENKAMPSQKLIDIALKHAGATIEQVSKLKSEFDDEDGKQIFEVEFDFNGMEYEYDIDTQSGNILKCKKEPADD